MVVSGLSDTRQGVDNACMCKLTDLTRFLGFFLRAAIGSGTGSSSLLRLEVVEGDTSWSWDAAASCCLTMDGQRAQKEEGKDGELWSHNQRRLIMITASWPLN